MTQSFLLYAPKIIFDFCFDILYFLPWWYSKGLKQTIKSLWNFLLRKEKELAVGVWIRNIHKPLLEQYGWQGRVKSIVLRIGQIMMRSVILCFWIFITMFSILLYVILPLLVIWQIIYQII